jgi:hypothetical protein
MADVAAVEIRPKPIRYFAAQNAMLETGIFAANDSPAHEFTRRTIVHDRQELLSRNE